jgi:hypothetical protein
MEVFSFPLSFSLMKAKEGRQRKERKEQERSAAKKRKMENR